jgi:hypothetical protein
MEAIVKRSKFFLYIGILGLLLQPAGAGLADGPPPQAVSLLSFSVSIEGQAVVVRWETATEVDTLGYHLHRQTPGGTLLRLNASLIPSQLTPGSWLGASYEFVDTSVEVGATYDYWLEIVDGTSQSTWEGPVTIEVLLIGDPVPPVPAQNLYRVFLPMVNH